ncbi:septal ring lytic transglycosylase RlpA family protein [Actinomadura roseirufa]|uniref:septal ring lytic transglycosylase RlpA family protein n=1 Tax=Actinomadura roseirufa TaxID=2094049 RepID=UPI001F5EB1AA|nr:septal ring lytic transglycosylase RlpA family protein [Actinomadura roseirufa]
MGSRRARLRTVLLVSGIAAAVIAAGVFTLVNSGGSAESAQAAQTAPRTPPPAAAPLPDPPLATPTRASRGRTRAPEPPHTKAAKPKQKPKAKAKPVKKAPSYKVLKSGSCEASYYWEGQMTASGEPFDPNALTAAHKTLPMGSKVRVTNDNNGRSVIVRINDRGPYAGGRCLDLSKAAMVKVGGTGSGVIPVHYEVLSRR